MPVLTSFDYAIVRVVPRVERAEFVNAGAIVFCRTRRYLAPESRSTGRGWRCWRRRWTWPSSSGSWR